MNLDNVITVTGCPECAGGHSVAWSSTMKSVNVAKRD